MSDELDFSKLSIDDVKLEGEQKAPEATGDNQDNPDTGAQGNPDTGNAEGAKADDSVDTGKIDDAKPAAQETKVDDKAPEPATYNFKDDFIKQAVEYYEKTGDLAQYLQAKTIDFNAMSDEEIMRRELREQYPDVSEKAFDKLFKQQVVDKFKLDADQWDEDDTELGKELLRTEASKLRAKYLDWQKGFKAPEPAPDNSADEALDAIKKFEDAVRTSNATKSLLESKRIGIKTADGEFNYEVQNPNELLDMTIDNNKFFAQFATPDGQVDYDKWYLTSAFAKDPESFIKSMGNYFKGLGREEITKEIKNPSDNKTGDIPTESSGDFASGLLQAFANRGVHK